MNREYFFAQDQAGTLQKVQVLGPTHPSDDATAAHAGFMVNAHSLAKASFTATYGRA